MMMADLIYQLVTDMDFDVVVEWAKILEVEVNPPPLDDMWPDWQGELRQEVVEAMEKVGVK